MKPFSQRKAVVLGSGKAGISMARFLLANGARVSVSDNSELQLSANELLQLKSVGMEFEAGGHTDGFIATGDLVAVSPGIPLDAPVIQHVIKKNIPLTGELGLFTVGPHLPKVAAVTGSNGKTTVTSLLGHLLALQFQQVFVGGNIGTPLLDSLSGSNIYQWGVLELSSFQLELVGDFKPDISMLLNCSPDHLDRHHTMKQYVAAKLNILKNQGQGDAVILGADDPLLAREQIPPGSRVYTFGTKPEYDACIENKTIVLKLNSCDKHHEVYDLSQTKMTSHVNLLNSAAAVLAAKVAGCSKKNIEKGLTTFAPPQHRMTPVGEINGVAYINDSKATNIGATKAALGGFSNPVVLIAGGKDKGGDFSLLRKVIEEKVTHLILIGQSADLMAGAFAGAVSIEHADSMEMAVNKAHSLSRPGDTVLLAPGCASFDMFTSYEERGEVFTEAVARLIKENQGVD